MPVPRSVGRNALQFLLPQAGCKLSWEGLALAGRGWADRSARFSEWLTLYWEGTSVTARTLSGLSGHVGLLQCPRGVTKGGRVKTKS